MRKAIGSIITVAALAVTPLLAGNGRGSRVDGGTGCPGATGGCGGLQQIVAGLPLEDSSAAEEADLLFMREEEKLARDVYMALDETWGLRIFGNISVAEQTHMDALLALLEKYALEDPVGANPPGLFSDPGLQSLFGELLGQGQESLVDALLVGARIEDLDIRDLGQALDRTDNTDVRTVYQNLRKASRNHLRSFVALLVANGVSYEPEFLSPAEFAEIVGSPAERGMVDADGEPVDCGGAGPRRGSGRVPASAYEHNRFGYDREVKLNVQ